MGKYIIFIVIIVGIVVAVFINMNKQSQDSDVINKEEDTVKSVIDNGVEITPIGHATAVLRWDNTVFYSDPVGGWEVLKDQSTPDVVFITHQHGDHLSTSTLKEVITENTVLITPQSVADALPDELKNNLVVLNNGVSFQYKNFNITAIPSYNIREEALQNHPKGRDNGYVIENNGTKVYFSGDSEDTKEMRELEDIDIAFIAMNLPYTMSVESAADAVIEFQPKRVYPYHYRTPEGFSDVAKFKSLVESSGKDIEVVQLEWY